MALARIKIPERNLFSNVKSWPLTTAVMSAMEKTVKKIFCADPHNVLFADFLIKLAKTHALFIT